MNRCLRSLSCFFTLAGLALFSTDATARASHKPHAQKAHEATKKSHAVKEARPHRSAASGKDRHTKHASAQRKPKPSKASPAPREAAHRSADGRSCAGEGSHRSRAQGKDPGGDGRQEQDRGSGGAKARRVVHPAPSGDDRAFQPLRGVHRRQSGLAEHGAAAPARGGAAVGGAQRCGDGSRLHRRSARQRQGQVRAGARAARRGRSGRRGQAGARRMAVGRIVGAPGDRRVRDVPRSSHAR